MPDTAGKVVGRMLLQRLNEIIKSSSGLIKNQHGFCESRSIVIDVALYEVTLTQLYGQK